jgi:molybdate transport system regulatory protein
MMKASARNQLEGIIDNVTIGAVYVEVFIKLKGGEALVASITKQSYDTLNIKVGVEVLALVKAPQIIVVSDFGDYKITARNQFKTIITHIKPGAVNAEVIMKLKGGETLTATITNDSVETLGLNKNAEVTAIFKASAVILAFKNT